MQRCVVQHAKLHCRALDHRPQLSMLLPSELPLPLRPCPCPQLAAVRKSMENVKQMVAQIQPAAAWAQGNLAVYQQQAAGLRAQVGCSCAVLQLCWG
jgi:hypothetical protein